MATSTSDLTRTFLHAAQQLGDRLLADLATKDPKFAEAVATAVANGERLVLSFSFSDEPVIEMTCVNDYGSSRRVCSIPLRGEVPPRARLS